MDRQAGRVTPFVIDTNALLSFITDRNLDQQVVVKKHIQKALSSQQDIVVLSHVISEFVYVLEKVYGLKLNKIHSILAQIADAPGFAIEDYVDLDELLVIWPNKVKNYGDAVLACFAISKKLPVLTFDQKFSRELVNCRVGLIK